MSKFLAIITIIFLSLATAQAHRNNTQCGTPSNTFVMARMIMQSGNLNRFANFLNDRPLAMDAKDSSCRTLAHLIIDRNRVDMMEIYFDHYLDLDVNYVFKKYISIFDLPGNHTVISNEINYAAFSLYTYALLHGSIEMIQLFENRFETQFHNRSMRRDFSDDRFDPALYDVYRFLFLNYAPIDRENKDLYIEDLVRNQVIDLNDKWHDRPLFYHLINAQNKEILANLIEDEYLDVHLPIQKSGDLQTLLDYVATRSEGQQEDIRLFELLFERGMDANTPSRQFTPFHLLVNRSNGNVTKEEILLFIENGARINTKMPYLPEHTVFDLALAGRINADILEYFIQLGATINHRDDYAQLLEQRLQRFGQRERENIEMIVELLKNAGYRGELDLNL